LVPANLVNLEAVSKTYGTRTLLSDVSLGIGEGERIGVVGRNGDGKTTLVRVLARHEPPDSGRVTHNRGLRLGLLPQHDELDPAATVRSVVLGNRPEHVWAGDARVRAVAAALLGDVPLDNAIGPLSGGERRRAALARLLVDEHDLLILDEPTNHLDVAAIDWLAGHLSALGSALLVVTHDRWFLDAVCERTWEVRGDRVHDYAGGYSAFVLAKTERARMAAAEESRRQNLLRKELAWLRRGPPARTSKPRFRVEAANALIAGEPPPRDRVELVRFAAARLGKTVLDLHDVTLAAGDTVLLDRLTWQLGPGDRVGVVGVNGSGKTTLLRLLAGELRPTAGRLVVGKTVRVAYLPQEPDAERLDPEQRVLPAVEEVKRVVQLGKGRELTAAQLIERFGFTGDRPWARVGDLSGGERRRLQLLRLLMTEPNVLLLDEPTNDLDIETLTALEDLLDGWAGTLVVVSHDRYFIERVCERVVALLGDCQLRDLPGGVEEYLARRRSRAPAGPERSRESRGDTRAARKELARVERRLDTLSGREARLHEELARHAADYTRVVELDAQLRALRDERAQLEESWLELAEKME
jgi:ABC transport system ATP-binding/permease protein